MLRRLEWLAGAYGVAGSALVLVLQRSIAGALVLTLAAAASIVAFRGLQGLVGRLQADAGTTTSEQRRDGGRRSRRFSRRFVWLRFVLLLLVPLASLWLDSERALALLLGFSVLPLAIMTEGLLQLLHVLAPGNHGH